jgi:probable DNA metabolism protein
VSARGIAIDGTYESWRDAARALAAADVPPSEVVFREPGGGADLFATDTAVPAAPTDALRVPRAFLDEAREVACNRADDRWQLLYRVLFRLTHGETELLGHAVDADVHRLALLAKEVRRDAHKMTAFVRFRRVGGESGAHAHYVAWHRPSHRVLPLVTPFFVERFASMHWTILTPDASVTWDGREARFGDGVTQSAAPRGDVLEELWRTYYASIFNPARLKLQHMRAEMPRKHWATLPEAQLIPTLVQEAQGRVADMVKTKSEYPTAAPFLAKTDSLEAQRKASKGCEGCPLYKLGTQTVFGEGSAKARLVLVGEQPGDEEDKQGHPFVGPAGRMLDKALAAAGIPRSEVYVTNAVKHFKWRPYGKRRLHQKPDGGEIQACKPWLAKELQILEPEVIVALGATAAQALLGKKATISRDRGQRLAGPYGDVVVSYHPSAILRAPDEAGRDEMFELLVADLRVARKALAA